MQDIQFSHADGRSAVASTATEAVTLRAMGFRQDAPAVEESPSTDWSHEQLDAHAVAHNFDLTGARTKPEKVAAIEAAAKAALESAETDAPALASDHNV